MKLKSLECVEKDATIEGLENENCIMKEEVVKVKDEMNIKDSLNEANLGKLNSVEETNKKLLNRVQIMEPLLNKQMHEIARLKTNKNPDESSGGKADNQDVKKMKLEIKTKNQTIKLLNEHKSELANEIKELQEKAHGGGHNKDVIDKS